MRHPKLVAAALDGSQSEQRRDGIDACPGETVELDGVPFIVTALKRQKLGET